MPHHFIALNPMATKITFGHHNPIMTKYFLGDNKKRSKQQPNFLKQKPRNFALLINGGNQATIDWITENSQVTIETFQDGD